MSSEKPASQSRRTFYFSGPADLAARVEQARRARAIGGHLPSRAVVLLAAVDAGLQVLSLDAAPRPEA